MARITADEHRRAVRSTDDRWAEIEVIEVDEPLLAEAAGAAHHLALRGYDAVHCVSAQQVSDPDLVAAAGDRKLLVAWHRLGLATNDVNRAV